MSASPTVFLVDDDDDVRVALTRALTKRGLNICSYPSADAFLNDTQGPRNGCLILDYGMPDMDGLELQEHLNAAGSDLPIIFITGHGGVPESVKATKAGALDFLEKPVSLSILLERIDTALELWASRAAEQDRRLARQKRLDTLTTREAEIFEFILKDPSHSSSKEIALALDISPRTVEIHRGRILKKLEVKTIVEMVDVFGMRGG